MEIQNPTVIFSIRGIVDDDVDVPIDRIRQRQERIPIASRVVTGIEFIHGYFRPILVPWIEVLKCNHVIFRNAELLLN